MADSMDAFSESLCGITHSFLRGSNEDIDGFRFASIEASHRTVFSSLLKHLKEAKYEHYVLGTEKQHRSESFLVESMQRLAQNIGALRSAAITQFSLLKEVRERQGSNPVPLDMQVESDDEANRLFTPPSPFNEYLPAERASEENSDSDSMAEEASVIPPSSIVFEEFIYHLGPPMVMPSP